MRKAILHGNGYVCDICGKQMLTKENIKVRSMVSVGRTGEYMSLDQMDVCLDCYVEYFDFLAGRGCPRSRRTKSVKS